MANDIITALLALTVFIALALGAPLEVEPAAAKSDIWRINVSHNYTVRVSGPQIRHIAPDLFLGDDYLLLARGNAIISSRVSDVPEILVISGSVEIPGYIEGAALDARFNGITSFLQLNKTHVVIADYFNHCLRLLNRLTNTTSPYVGVCGKPGDVVDGPANQVIFNQPSDVMFDKRDPTKLIILDDYNDAIRSLDTKTMIVSTIFMNETTMPRPRYGIFDMDDPDIMYITIMRQIVKYSFKDNKVTLITGLQPATQEDKLLIDDGDLSKAKLGYFMAGIAQISPQFIFFSDHWNDKVRILDLYNNQIYSLCDDRIEQVFGEVLATRAEECNTYRPSALLYKDGKLYIGENIRIAVKSITVSSGSAISAKKDCESTVNTMIGVNETTAQVKLDDGRALELTAGQFIYSYYGKTGVRCETTIIVKKKVDSSLCMKSMDKVASRVTKTATVVLPFGDVTQTLELPIGQHPYHLNSGDISCNMTINVFDDSLKRVMEFMSTYSFECKNLNFEPASSLIGRTAQHNSIYINEICGDACSVLKAEKSIRMSCSNGTLTVVYPTDVVFGGDVKQIPERLATRLADSLKRKGITLTLVDTERIPPIVLPQMTPEGASARIILTSSCDNDKRYDADTDTCN